MGLVWLRLDSAWLYVCGGCSCFFSTTSPARFALANRTSQNSALMRFRVVALGRPCLKRITSYRLWKLIRTGFHLYETPPHPLLNHTDGKIEVRIFFHFLATLTAIQRGARGGDIRPKNRSVLTSTGGGGFSRCSEFFSPSNRLQTIILDGIRVAPFI